MRDENVSWAKTGEYFGRSRSWSLNLKDQAARGDFAKKMGRPKPSSDQLDDTIRHLSHNCQARDWPAGRIMKVALDSLTGKRPKLSERTVQRRLKACSARIVTPVKNPLTYHHRTMRVFWALDLLDRLKKDKNYLNYVAFSDEASLFPRI
ncbi:hypothetical protein RvY_15888 [Ramazzottius varieornatus]|uniref:Transposase Tc1-like domain-containing protein n=1 Tax=Ramazzottius varieornatus TaxID=947166 RepID=A0A1D1VZJ7_RAMVA|nr:hypothetical protein RvY_15888 [Ramazzottius varieornatus]